MAVPLTLSSVPAQTPYVQYIATAGQTVFPYPFEITQDSDLVVLINGSAQPTDNGYSLSGQGATGGGNVTFAVGLSAGTIVTFYRNITIARITQLSQNGTFFSANFNNEYNRIYLILQQLQQSLPGGNSAFALMIPNSNSPPPTTLLTPSVYKNTYLSFDGNGNPQPALLTSSGSITGSIISSVGGQLATQQTAAEIAASVVPTNLQYAPFNPLRYGAVGSGLVDDHIAVQAAFTVAGVAGGTVIFPAGYTFLCNADITVPVAASPGGPLACAQGPGWATISVVFGTGATFGFIILGTGATTGGATGSTYNNAGTFRDIGIQLGASMSAFYANSVNQPKFETCRVYGAGTTSNRAGIFLNCLLPVFEDCLVTGCGSASQYSVEFDGCTTALWRGSRISGGNTTNGGLAIDRCTNFVGDGMAIESCGTPIVIGGKTESSLACTGVTLRGLELENPGSLGQYISIGAGLTSSALVLDVLIDGMFGAPSGTTTVAYGVKMSNIVGFEAKGCHFTLGSAPTSCFELANANISGVVIRPHRNLASLGVAWVRYNGTQVLAAGPQVEWVLGAFQSTGGRPTCTNRGYSAAYSATNLTGATPSILISSSMGGFYSSVVMANGGATTVTSLSGGEPGMEITIIAADSNTTLTNGNSGGTFRLISGGNLNLSAGRAYKFYNDGASGASGGSCWVQL